MPADNPGATPASAGQSGGSGATEAGGRQSYWFHILARNSPAARSLHAVKLAEKAWQQGDRVCLVCDTVRQAQELDELLWNLAPEAFIPHSVLTDSASRCSDPVGIQLSPPAAEDWDTVIILCATLPADADRFRRLALVAHNDPDALEQARSHFRQLRALSIEPRVHDQRRR